MARPASYPLIATDANFEGGDKDGQPTKLAVAALLEQGFVPGGDGILAQYLNGLFNLTAAWLLAHSQELDVLSGASAISVTVGSNQDNYSPPGWQDAVRVHFTGFAGSPVVTGFVAPQTGKPTVKFFTSDATGTLLLAYETTSTNANRLRFGRQVAGQSLYASIKAGDCGVLVYSAAASRWFVFVAPAQRTRVTTAKSITGGGATNHNVPFTDDELNSDALSLTTTSGAATVTGFLMPTNPHYKSGVKLLLIGSSITFNSGDGGSDASNRLTVTGGNWAAVNGDAALLHEAASGTGWILHPLKPPGAGGGATENEIAVSVTADASDWNPSGWQDCTQATITATGGPWTLSGLAAPASGKPRVKRLVVAAGTIILAYSAPTPANVVSYPQLNTSEPGNVSLLAGDTATVVYATDNKWHLLMPARPEGYSRTLVYTAGTNLALALGSGYATSAIQIGSSGAGPYVIKGIQAAAVGALVRGHWKLVQFNIAGTVVHQSVDATSGNRVIVSTGSDWSFVVGDYAMLAYDPVATRWLLHPLKTFAGGLSPTTVTSGALKADTAVRGVWGGGTDVALSFDETGARDGVQGSLLIMPGMSTFSVDTKFDPEQVLRYAFNDSGSAYLFQWEFLAGACVHAHFSKVTTF